MFVLLEMYYADQCPVNAVHTAYNEQILLVTLAMLKQFQIPHTAIFGTSLQIARNTKIAPWDHDSDWMIEKPKTQTEISKLISDMTNYLKNTGEYKIVYYAKRSLIQIKKPQYLRAHADIWLFENVDDNILKNNDYTVAVTEMPYDWFFPAKEVSWDAYQTMAPMPNKFENYATAEFGPNYMTPYYNRMQCIENLVTQKAGPDTYMGWFIAIALANTLTWICIYRQHILRCKSVEKFSVISGSAANAGIRFCHKKLGRKFFSDNRANVHGTIEEFYPTKSLASPRKLSAYLWSEVETDEDLAVIVEGSKEYYEDSSDDEELELKFALP